MRKPFLLLATFYFSACFAQSGSVDPDFGINGKITANLGFPVFQLQSGCIQADGKIVVAGWTSNVSTDFFLARFTANGSLDSGFGTNGVVYTDINQGTDELEKVISLPDGRIIAVGSTSKAPSYTPAITLCRYKPDGMPDSTFNGTGIVVALTLLSATVTNVGLQPDGKVLVCTRDGYNMVQLFRFNTDGSLDNSYTQYNFRDNNYYWATSLALLPDGKVLVAGFTDDHATKKIFIARFDASGNLDGSFAGSGKIMLPALRSFENTISLRMSSGGRFYVSFAHREKTDFTGQIKIMRYTPQGIPDSTFGTEGVQWISRTDSIFFHSIPAAPVAPPDGKLLFAGVGNNAYGVNQFAAMRLDATGSPDSSFGRNGYTNAFLSGTRHEGVLPLLQPDGKIIIAGYEFEDGRYTVALTRLNPNGVPDSSFSNNAIAAISIGTGTNHAGVAQNILLRNNGRVLTAGYSKNGGFTSLALAQFYMDGTPDSTFGNRGRSYACLYEMPGWRYDFYDEWVEKTLPMATDAYDNIFVLAPTYSYLKKEKGISLYKFRQDGRLDSLFGLFGKKDIDFVKGQYEYALGMVIQPDGKLLLAVRCSGAEDSSSVGLLRLVATGAVDSTFGVDGKVIDRNLDGNLLYAHNQPRALALQRDGKILLTGKWKSTLLESFALRRYTTSGMPDTVFNGGGVAATDTRFSKNYATSVAVQQDGKIVVGGITGDYKSCVIRYDSLGRLDYSFGNAGIVDNILGKGFTNDIALQEDGKILILRTVVFKSIEDIWTSNKVARLMPDGTPDYGFGSSGTVRTDGLSVASALAPSSDNHILVCGAIAGDHAILGLTNCTLETPVITAVGPTTFCQDTSTVLISSLNQNQWYRDGISISGTTAQTLTVNQSGTYTAINFDKGCSSLRSNAITVVTKIIPLKPTINAVGNVLSSSYMYGNQWYLNGVALAGADDQQYKAQASGLYAVQQTYNGCSSTSDAFNFVATSIVNTATWNNEVRTYPNPASEALFIENAGKRRLAIQLLDMNGKRVHETSLTTSGMITVKNLVPGIYVLLVTDVRKKETITKIIIKQ